MPGRHSRRTVLAALTALPAAGALGACSGPSAASAHSPGRGRTTITFWSALRGSQQVVDEYNKTHDRIHVVYEQVPSGAQGGDAKLNNAARAGNAPDIATTDYSTLPSFAIDGVTRDVTSLMSEGFRRRLLPQALALTTFADRSFGVPVDIEPMVLHYRKDLFDHYGIHVPSTWDEYEDTASAVRRAAPDRRLGPFWSDGWAQFIACAWQAGARWYGIHGDTWNISMADGPTRKVAAYWQRLIDTGLVFMNPGSGRQSDAQIAEGLVLTRLNGAWDAGAQMTAHPSQKGQWRIAALPQWDLTHPYTGTQGGSTYMITKDSRNPEAAMEFVEWLVGSPAALRARLASGASSQYPAVPDLMPVARSGFDRSYYGGQDIYRLFDAEAQKIRQGWIWGPRMSPTTSVLTDGFARVSAGRGTLIDAVRAAQSGTMPDLRAIGLSTTQHSG
ncbi:ABC transporter substrate-binding protein [Streptomyces sp. NBC_01497]|uniref:ABC transporter substrate-binding protein n=1 Tax=Streptomyces sp. NBC_01497 TaxID=2903885 RepID=UPI002E34B58E|nr:extracellular solute-binding protein [Streptomyces sp. NBC_01497]